MASPIPTQLSPGVKVSEIDLSQFVQPVSFSRGGMAGVFNWGPSLVATTVSTESELAGIFGKPTLDQSDSTGNKDFLAASNFLKYSSNLRLVRVLQDGDYNAVSPDPGITWIGSVDNPTVSSEDEFRSLGGFSGSDGIETKSYFKARYPGNFGNSIGVVVFDGVTTDVQSVTTEVYYKDFTLSGGYANPNTLTGISYGTAGISLQAYYVGIDPNDTTLFALTAISAADGGVTRLSANWKMLTFNVPSEYTNAAAFIQDFKTTTTLEEPGTPGVPICKFLYATGTTSENRTRTQNGSQPDGNNGNLIQLRRHGENWAYSPFCDSSYSLPINRVIVENPNDARKVDMVFWELDMANAIPSMAPGKTGNFGSLGEKTIATILPWVNGASSLSNATGMPSSFMSNPTLAANQAGSVFSSQFNDPDFITTRFLDDLTWIDGFANSSGSLLWSRYINLANNVSTVLFGTLGSTGNGFGLCNYIGLGITGSRTIKANFSGATATINFDPNSGITGLRNNFANGIVQFGKSGLVQFTETRESQNPYQIFDKMPGTSQLASSVGGSNDEISIAVVDTEGKFGPRGGLLERFELLSKATDATNIDGQSIYYKDYINKNSKFIYCSKPFGYTGGGNASSPATTSFGDIYTQYVEGGTTFNRTGFYDAYLSYGESSTDPASETELIEAYSLFADDDNAVDVVFLPEATAIDDSSGDPSTVEQAIYDYVVEPRKDTILVIPTPPPSAAGQYTTFTASKAVRYRKESLSLPSNSYTILVAGRKVFFDPYNNQTRKMSLASDVAGILCAQEIPWESPAGFARGMLKNSVKLETKFTKTDRDELYKNQVNFFVEFNDGSGTALFGDKTLLVKPSAFDRVNVRRVFIAIEKAIAKAAQYSLFEFNDEFTRAQFRNLIIPFLRSMVAQRGLIDFKVVCDETNNTAEVIDKNQFVADIYLKPTKTSNFIQLNFIAVRSDLSLSTIE